MTIPYLCERRRPRRGGLEIVQHPRLIQNWERALTYPVIPAHPPGRGLIFPKRPGMSGFETGVAVMPLIANRKGTARDEHQGERKADSHWVHLGNTEDAGERGPDHERFCSVRASHHLALVARGRRRGRAASGRALAYLEHHYLGHGFGSVYDVTTLASSGSRCFRDGRNAGAQPAICRASGWPRWVAYAGRSYGVVHLRRAGSRSSSMPMSRSKAAPTPPAFGSHAVGSDRGGARDRQGDALAGRILAWTCAPVYFWIVAVGLGFT